ncbi:glycosyltransferase family 2 protein [Stenomitos frigidus]|uniref:Glycosyltransferase family 2 protein n=1 Tax=Stenomitos frigidus ULC18 TaxID=2107698 RepID=A0A2T1DZX0_9CYAN|nr:glycosyltransferase family 2 protein [Stenomitos frigidus]PSB26047.1 glycosyltransferase family 2 protein [Stenomitos frigidus ULC18]
MTLRQSVFILIPAYNRKTITLQCLETLKENGDLGRYQVVVIDDGSTDGTGQAIQTAYPDVTVLEGDGNLWWTGAIVQGMVYASQQGAALIIWLNDDCTPSPGALSQLVTFWQTHPQSIVGAACYNLEDNTLHATGAQGRKRMAAKPGEMIAVDEMSGHCVGIPIAVVQQIGLPDVYRFPHYHGDSMYILKATRASFPAYILGDAKIYHAGVIKAKLEDFLDQSGSQRSCLHHLSTVFCHKKSFYFLPTQCFYYLQKYGAVAGCLIFLAKVTQWSIRFIQLGLRQPISRVMQ